MRPLTDGVQGPNVHSPLRQTGCVPAWGTQPVAVRSARLGRLSASRAAWLLPNGIPRRPFLLGSGGHGDHTNRHGQPYRRSAYSRVPSWVEPSRPPRGEARPGRRLKAGVAVASRRESERGSSITWYSATVWLGPGDTTTPTSLLNERDRHRIPVTICVHRHRPSWVLGRPVSRPVGRRPAAGAAGSGGSRPVDRKSGV